jgi:hypothetical protein
LRRRIGACTCSRAISGSAKSFTAERNDAGAPLGRRFALVALLALFVLAARLGTASQARPGGALATIALDFRVVYCGAEAVRTGHDPYRVEPLRSCEHRVGREPGEPDWAVTPLPLPGYAIALFVPLSLLSFGVAKALYVVLLVLGFALAAACVAAIARMPTLAVAAVFAPTIGFGINLYYGEPVPLAIGALCAAAYALERGAPRSAAALAVLASVEPHVALPAILALALLVPRSRAALVIALVAGAALSLLAIGFAANVEYVAVLLPQHGTAELLARDQLGLSRYLALAGMPARAALALGSASYVAAIAFGIIVGRRAAAALDRPSLAMLFPVAAAMLGGSFIHDVQIAAALPAAVLLAPYAWSARIAIALLVVDWTSWWRGQLLPVATGAAGAAAATFPPHRARAAFVWFAGATVLSLALLSGIARVPDRPVGVASVRRQEAAIAPPGAVGALRPDDSASRAWALRIALDPGWDAIGLHDLADKIPLWAGLALLLYGGATVRRKPPETRRAAA